MKVCVLRDGRYNGPGHRAITARAGDVIEVAGGWYAEALIHDGFVAPYEPEPEATATEEKKAPPRGKRTKGRRRAKK